MKKIFLFAAFITAITACKQSNQSGNTEANKQFAAMCETYYQDGLKLNPIAATFIGDERYNDLLPNDGSLAYIQQNKSFNERYLDSLKNYDRESLNANDKLSFDYMKDQISMNIEGFKYHPEYLPFNQMFALPLMFGQLGSGTGAQPFKTVKNYEDWLKRASAFSVWADTAIGNFKKGASAGIVLPKALVVKMIPQMQSMVVATPEQSLFYGPVKLIPSTFSATEKQKITEEYRNAISNVIIPAYKKLGDFLQNEYLPKARTTSGYSAMPGGAEWYAYLVRQQTTTNKTPEEVYQTGLKEVARIKAEMDSIKNQVGFKGDLKTFFEYMKTDKKFMPYKNPKEILDAFEDIHQRMKPNLKKMFESEPKTPFEIRQTEAFRAASASAEYNQGSADGKRPGIFYVPILDATKFNTTSGMESLFLHEAIPGHHYQISLTQENTLLPNFRRFGGHNAYVEGWALYCESLGKELGLYQDPYQHMGALGDEMHRAIRLVVDVAIHTKNMTREQAIKYMTDNEAISTEGATAEIERYMGIPAQALGYKTGAMKIRELRNKYEKELGSKFKLAAFHTEVLKDGSLPLSVFENKMNAWAESQK
ncbi:DUF885 domain-containing protein [Pedobacter jamesrossensis]|uniref:DUF885 domain-containing protein n=1 Tax=Pedobacter jamesrossensis TaxID=1908238 RepID=A0ABV8NR11_9SPHI